MDLSWDMKKLISRPTIRMTIQRVWDKEITIGTPPMIKALLAKSSLIYQQAAVHIEKAGDFHICSHVSLADSIPGMYGIPDEH